MPKSDTPKWDKLSVRSKNLEFPPFLKQRTGAITQSNLANFGAHGTQTDAAADRLRVGAVLFPQRCRLNQLGIVIDGAGGTGAECRIGIYEDGGDDHYPSNLVLDAGTVSAESTGIKTISIDLILEPGIYWLGEVHNDGTIDLPWTGGDSHKLLGKWKTQGWVVDHSYGSLQDPFPSGGITEISRVIRYRIAEWL